MRTYFKSASSTTRTHSVTGIFSSHNVALIIIDSLHLRAVTAAGEKQCRRIATGVFVLMTNQFHTLDCHFVFFEVSIFMI